MLYPQKLIGSFLLTLQPSPVIIRLDGYTIHIHIMRKLQLLTLSLYVGISSLFAQVSTQTYFLGHSLVNLDMPAMFHSLALDAGYAGNDYDYQVGNGANLWAQYTPPFTEQGIIYNVALPTGVYENFVFTEAVPIKNHLIWSYTDEYADSLFEVAYAGNNTIRTYFYETWHCIHSGTSGCGPWDNEDHIAWRTRLTEDLDDWESVLDSLEADNPGNTFYMVPGGQGMARLYDAIEASTVPGMDSIQQFFLDDIHLNDEGNYYIACIMFATLYGESPVGLTNQTFDEWASPFNTIPLALAERLQELAWETVCNYPRSGVVCNLGLDEMNNAFFSYSPSMGIVFSDFREGKLQVLDITGKILIDERVQQLVVPLHLNRAGIYLARFIGLDGRTTSIKFIFNP